MRIPLTSLDRAIELVLRAGLLLSGALLVVGIAGELPEPLHWGVLLMMMIPVARVVGMAVSLLRQRDWSFAAASLWILGVLAWSMSLALR